ncbi:hypothetical protein [Actinoplanes subglobosus]|uniref:PH domain-containing protein n=1 Tax=Actinoplanes subglobosus TaxID=1547892 RepID=A0ABV8IMD5_9ACTN
MANKVFTQVGRHPAVSLAVALALAVAVGLLDAAGGVTGLIVAVVFGLAIAAHLWFHPVALETGAEPPAFSATNNAFLVLLMAGATFLSTTSLVRLPSEVSGGDTTMGVGLAYGVFWAVLILLAWGQLLRPGRVRLLPTGIEDVQAFGTMFIPWEAFAGVDYPAVSLGRDQVVLTCSDERLIRNRGWRPRRYILTAHGVDALFLARVIHEYAHRPERRPAIGTVAERDRLLVAWAGAPVVP